ncbi:acyl-CoA dehydrogenase family protein [Streptomyces cynarae]|uniref:Acyl-CoA dehydrogenase family protein n=1 Tax=Streptomyces cynarae TaxID=2981134 RepID=A0ABY6DWD7_9ACTN|nr:acyl-CoA dehydrogenase family protein [Streptomyces cynarae]UXY18660.1 acyl-CoA dehydrogenase family protein [Streptomyces cynarae]
MEPNQGRGGILALLDRKPVSDRTAEWLARVDRIAPVVEKWREEGERRRSSPVAVFEALQDGGFHRMLVARDLGGSQVPLETGSEVLQALARHDPAVAWQMAVQAAIGRLSDYLPEQAARELFRDQDALVVGSVNPTGQAEAVDGGYRLSGRWGFASGSAHAAWLVCAARVTVDGTPRTTEHGPDIRMLFVPRTAVRMLDNWHTLGLRGTGSEDYEIDGVFVGEEYTVSQRDMFSAPPDRPSRGYGISYYDFGLFGSSSTVLGTARAALREFQRLATVKKPMAGTSTLAASHTVQDRFARAEAQVRASRLLLADAAWHAEQFGEVGAEPLSATVRLAAATVAEHCCEAISSLFTVAGTSSLYASSMLERYFRDAHSAAKHITLSPTNIEMVGQYLLGGGLSMRR